MTDTRRRRRRPPTPATNFLIGAILLGVAIEVLSGAWTNPERLIAIGAMVPVRVAQGEYWRLLTAMFLHGDGSIPGTILHVAMNLFALFQLGSLYESMFGTRRFVMLYFVTGLIASIASFVNLYPFGVSVGASGAIFGILGAFIFSVRRSPRWRHERWARSLVAQCVFWMIANILIGLRVPIIDQAAHMGGLISGLILGAVLPHRVPPPPPSETVIDVQPHDDGSTSP